MTTDQRLAILADYVIGEMRYRAVAKKHGVKDEVVRQIIHRYGAMRTAQDWFFVHRRRAV